MAAQSSQVRTANLQNKFTSHSRSNGAGHPLDDPAHSIHTTSDQTSHSAPPPDYPELPPAPVSHHFGQGWSAAHPIPTISGYRAEHKMQDQQADEYAHQRDVVEARHAREQEEEARRRQIDGQNGGSVQGYGTGVKHQSNAGEAGQQNSSSGGLDGNRQGMSKHKHIPSGQMSEKEEMKDRMNANQQKPTDRLGKMPKGERRVRDPITDQEIIIKDTDPKDFDASHVATKGGNILLHPFPPPQPASLGYINQKLNLLSLASFLGLSLCWAFMAFGHGFWRFARCSAVCGGVGAVLVTLISLISKNLEREVNAIRTDMHRTRGAVYSPPSPESVEWLNSLISLIWRMVDPSFFIPIADTLEDIMQASLPGFIEAISITDVGQGDHPLRITSIRGLDDRTNSASWPRTHWIDGGKDAPTKDTSGNVVDEDEAGDYYNFEISFAYNALPGKATGARAKNIHLLLEFFIGAFDWLSIPIPIWIQIEQIMGTVRLRAQCIPQYPYVRNLTFTFCGVPSVDIAITPLSKHIPDVFSLPGMNTFVAMAIKAGTAELCAPKSMTLNLQEMLSGPGLGDTRAVGIFVVTIHYAEGLSAQDKNGKSDPYVVLAYAKFGKPMYSTRIILEDLNPVWEETTMLLLTEDEIKSKEDLSAMLWDSDARTADDLVGRIQLPVRELMKNPNEMHRRADQLMGFEDADKMSGKLHWSIGYFTKIPLKELEWDLSEEEKKAQPAPAKTAPAGEMSPKDKAPLPAKSELPPPPADVEKTRPDPAFPSGVLSITLHQVNTLERQDIRSGGRSGKREGRTGQDTDTPAEESDNLPSGYGEIIVNDEVLFKTRVKQYNTDPYFEAGTEVFIKDFRDTIVRVVIRDSRLREADPIMGIINLRLADLFKESSSVTSLYALTEGVGYGKANISVAFRGMHTKLPKNLLGWSVGTLQVGDVAFEALPNENIFPEGGAKLTVHTSDSTIAIPKKEAEHKGNEIFWHMDEPLRMPVYARYSTSCVFELGSHGGLAKLVGKAGPDAIAVIWLQDLTDDAEQELNIPVFAGENLANLRQNAINDFTGEHHDFRCVGWLRCVVKFDSGLDTDHQQLLDTGLSQNRRHALEAYDHVEGEAEIAEKNSHADDDGVIDKKEQKSIDDAHKRQLISRGRGPAQIKAYRQLQWMKRGIKSRLMPKSHTREPTIQTEA